MPIYNPISALYMFYSFATNPQETMRAIAATATNGYGDVYASGIVDGVVYPALLANVGGSSGISINSRTARCMYGTWMFMRIALPRVVETGESILSKISCSKHRTMMRWVRLPAPGEHGIRSIRGRC